jgi:hypothetical protein
MLKGLIQLEEEYIAIVCRLESKHLITYYNLIVYAVNLAKLCPKTLANLIYL